MQKMLDIYSLLGVMFCTNYFMKHFGSIFINHLVKGLWKLQIAGVGTVSGCFNVYDNIE